MTKSQSAINDELGEEALHLMEAGEYVKVLDIIRKQTNPLTAAWLATFLINNVSQHNSQFKNWLANATYNGK